MSNQGNDIPEGFKMTELGPLPEEWEVVRSAEKLLLNDSGVWGHDLEEGERGVEVLRSTNMQDGKWVFEDVARRRITENQFRRYCLRQGDILITKSSGSRKHIGKAAYVDSIVESRQCVFSNFMQRLRLNDDVCPRFVFFFIVSESGKDALLSRSTTTTGLRNLQKTDFENIISPLPPLPEQQAIAEVLSTIQTAIEAQDKIIAAAREMKKSVMKHVFTYGPVPVAEAEKVLLKETEIGPVPEHWALLKLDKIASARGGIGFPPKYQGQLRGDYPFYKVSDMNLTGNERFMRKANNMVDNNVVSLLRARPFPRDTVIFPKVGAAVHTNKKRLLVSDALVDNNVMGVTIFDKSKCIPEYLLCWFESVDIGEFSNPGPLPSINAHSVKDRTIPFPPLYEQQEIARILSSVDKKIEAEANRKASLQTLFRTMLHQLMTGKVRVKDPEVGVA